MNKKKFWAQIVFLVFLIAGSWFALQRQAPFQQNEGKIFGTIYHIKYQSKNDLKAEIVTELLKVDASLSPFNKQSVITAINQNQEIEADTLFRTVFRQAEKISQQTEGAFDITVAPLVNAWGFGFKTNAFPDSNKIDSLKQFIGYTLVALKNGHIVKKDPRIMLDCSSIAKGYGCDRVAALLDRKGITNYMIEIGGEIVVKGKNPQNSAWSIGISKPTDDSLAVNQELQTILQLSDIAMATSGNYRNFYYKDGKKYAHTINPHTGYPVQHSLLSATVLAPDCMTADAYATSFMVMGLEKAKKLVESQADLDAYFIYTDDEGRLQTWSTEGMKSRILKP